MDFILFLFIELKLGATAIWTNIEWWNYKFVFFTSRINCMSTGFSIPTNHNRENCLTLSVFTHDCKPDKLKPCIVWIHGGAVSSLEFYLVIINIKCCVYFHGSTLLDQAPKILIIRSFCYANKSFWFPSIIVWVYLVGVRAKSGCKNQMFGYWIQFWFLLLSGFW